MNFKCVGTDSFRLSIFFLKEVSRYYATGTKQNVNKIDRKLHKEIFAAVSKIWSRKKEGRTVTKPANDCCRICKYFFNVNV